MNLDNHLIESVTTVDGSTVYNEIGWVEAKYKSSNRYTSNKPDYFIRNEYLYIIQKKGASVIAITGLFENPYEVINYESVCGECESCDNCVSPLDLEFPIDDDMIDTLIEMSLQELLMIFSQAQEDKTNDATDGTNFTINKSNAQNR